MVPAQPDPEIVDTLMLLYRKVRPDRMGAVLEAPCEALGGRSIIRAWLDGDATEVRAVVEQSFDWSTSA